MRKVKYTLIFIFLMVIGRQWLYNQFISYKIISSLPTISITDKTIIAKLTTSKELNEFNIENILKKSKDITDRTLHYSFKKCTNNPNHFRYISRANCIGYAALFSSITNHLLKQFRINKYQINHVRGQILFMGINLHQFSTSPFFKNHDFVVITNIETGENKIYDPSIADVFGLDVRW